MELFRTPPERYLDVAVGEVAYRRVGTGPDVLFVHGWPVSGATFRTLVPHLAEHVTCHLIDLPGAGDGRVRSGRTATLRSHVDSVRQVVDTLGFDRIAVVGHDSGAMIARHAMAGDARLSAMGLIDTEQSQGMSLRFRAFVGARHVPGFGRVLGWAVGRPRIRRSRAVLGDAFADRSLLDGEFDELFLQPLHTDRARLDTAMAALRSFDPAMVHELAALHRRIEVPVQLVWGEQDRFFPVHRAREMVGDFADARLSVVEGAGLFSHEERPAEVAEALLDVLR